MNSQGLTRKELLENLREALAEAIELNREEARSAADASRRFRGTQRFLILSPARSAEISEFPTHERRVVR